MKICFVLELILIYFNIYVWVFLIGKYVWDKLGYLLFLKIILCIKEIGK